MAKQPSKQWRQQGQQQGRKQGLPLAKLLPAFVLALFLTACADKDPDSPAPLEPDPSLPRLPNEETGRVETLPAEFPDSWIFVDEANFWSMLAGKVILLDAAESKPAAQMKGLIDKSLIGNFTQAQGRAELYVVETFHERGTRGKRTDVLTIYDKTTLAPKSELILPIGRLVALPLRYALAVSADEKFLYITNFTPAQSFTVVDLDTKKVVTTIDTPGCSLVYPSGNRKVVSICGNGSLLTTTLNNSGTKKMVGQSEPFFDSTHSPVFERPAIIGDIAYVPSFTGTMFVADLSGDAPQIIDQWSLVSDEERSKNYRPGGLGLIDQDDAGNLYLIFHADGTDGTHQHGGPEVWVFNPSTKKKVRTIATPNWAISLGVTQGDNPYLVTTNGELNLDVFDANSGEFVHTISGFGNVTPLFIHKAY